MTGLLDTNAFLWLDQDPSQLTPAAAQFIQDSANDVLLSVASVWEMVIKVGIGKLPLTDPVAVVVRRQLGNGVRLIDATLDHVLAVQNLPAVHRDPFDRLLAAQAVTEGAALVTADPVFRQYPVQVIW